MKSPIPTVISSVLHFLAMLIDSGINIHRTVHLQRRYEIINIPCDFYAYQSTSLWVCPHIVPVLKLKNCGILKGSLAQTLWFWSLVTFILVWIGDPEGSLLKITIKVYYAKSTGIKVMTQHFSWGTWCIRTSSGALDCSLWKLVSQQKFFFLVQAVQHSTIVQWITVYASVCTLLTFVCTILFTVEH